MNILYINKRYFSKSGFDILKKKGHKVNFSNNPKNINQYDVLIIRPDTYIKDLITKNTKIKFIISVSTGINHINLIELKKNRIKLFHLNNKKFLSNIKATSEHTIYLILSSLRLETHKSKSISFQDKKLSSEVSKRKIGIVGYGRVGKHVSKVLNAFGADIFFYDIKNLNHPNYVKQCASMTELFKKTDLISLHIPLNDNNFSLIDQKHKEVLLNKTIINTSRAEIFNENFLMKMIKSKNIKYITDVVHDEGGNFKNSKLKKLFDYENLLITPHIAGLTNESIDLTDKYLINKFLKFYEKKY